MEARLFNGDAPIHTTPEWYAKRDRAPHLEQPEHRERLLLTADMVNQALRDLGLWTISDMGCGDGGLLSLIQGQGVECWGYDLQPTNIVGARERGVDVFLGDAVRDPVEWGDVTVCTEMLEHLVDPHAFVRMIPSKAIIASSPATETEIGHYEYHTWAWDEAGYRLLFQSAGFRVVRQERSGIFQVVLAVRS